MASAAGAGLLFVEALNVRTGLAVVKQIVQFTAGLHVNFQTRSCNFGHAENFFAISIEEGERESIEALLNPSRFQMLIFSMLLND